MIIDRTHRRWIIASLLILGVCIGTYIPYQSRLNGPEGDSWPGLAYGSIAMLFVLIAAGIQVRKKVRTWRVGRAQTWMRAHIWLGLLSLPIALLHSGFDFGPPFSLAWIMMWSFVSVIFSGVLGLILQHILPRMMLKRVRKETVIDQIDNIRQQLKWEADWIISGVCGALPDELLDQAKLSQIQHEQKVEKEHKAAVAAAKKAKKPAPPAPHRAVSNPAKVEPWQANHGIRLKSDRSNPPNRVEGSDALMDFYQHRVQPFLADRDNRSLNSEVKSTAAFNRVRNLTPTSLHEQVNDIEAICDEARQLKLQQTLHFWLHSWLMIHGPVSWAVVTMAIIHAVAALYY